MRDTAARLRSLGLAINTSNSHAAGDTALKESKSRTLPSAIRTWSLHPPLLGPLLLHSTSGLLSGLACLARGVFLLFKVSPRKQELVWSEMLSSKQPMPGGAGESLGRSRG